MSDIISDFLNSYGGDLLGAGATYLANQQSAKSATALAGQLGVLNSDAVNALKGGYQQQLTAQEQLTPKVDSLLNDYETKANTNVNTMGTDNAAIADQYGDSMYNTAGDAAAQYATGAGDYAGTMVGTLDSSLPYLQAGFQGMNDTLQPYVQTGDQARDYLSEAMGQDPSQMTPTQKLLYDKYQRDSVANLNASGLRGAGRAGVAAVNQGLADLDAKFYDSNRARSDTAANTLSTQGYGATGAIATGQKDLGQQATQLNYDTGEKLANNAKDLAKTTGDLTLSTGKDVAGNTEGLAQKTTDVGFNTAQNTAQNKLNTDTSLASGLATARGDTAMGVAQADAQGYINQGITAAQKAAIDNYSKGSTFNSISNILAGAKSAPIA